MPLANIFSILFPVATAITIGAILIAMYVKERDRYQQPENNRPRCNRTFSSTFQDTRNTENFSSNEDCVICIARMNQNDNLRMLRCFHQFHRACVDVSIFFTFRFRNNV